MKQFLMGVLLVMAIVLVGCQNGEVESSGERSLKENEKEKQVEQPVESEVEEQVEEQVEEGNTDEFVSANEGKTQRTKEELEEEKLYEWALNEEITAFVVQEGGEVSEMEHNSPFGETGDQIYSGAVSLYLVHEAFAEGFLQESIESVSLNLVTDFSEEGESLNGESVISWTEIQASNSNVLSMWRYSENELKRVLFDGSNQIGVTNKKMRWIDEQHIQTYYYDNAGMGDTPIGWHYQTWKWIAAEEFQQIDTRFFGNDVDEVSLLINQKWNQEESSYFPFETEPVEKITLTEGTIKLLTEGRFTTEGPKVGDSIIDFLLKSPAPTGNDYYNGGRYYTVNDTVYFYDELNGEITHIWVGSSQLKNELDEVRSLLGEPSYDGYVEYIDANMARYTIGDSYNLNIEYDLDGANFTLMLSGNGN